MTARGETKQSGGRTSPDFQLFVQWELNDDVCDAQKTWDKTAVESASAFCAIDGDESI